MCIYIRLQGHMHYILLNMMIMIAIMTILVIRKDEAIQSHSDNALFINDAKQTVLASGYQIS